MVRSPNTARVLLLSPAIPPLSSLALVPYTDERRMPRLPGAAAWFSSSSIMSDTSVNLQQLQDIIRNTYDAKDRRRGVEGTFMWFMEEVGELSAALRSGSDAERAAEFADVLAWLATLANIAGVDLEGAVAAKYGGGCPGCRRSPCVCDQAEKP